MVDNGETGCRWCFFLGGRDLEMEAIADLLRAHVPTDRIVDRRPSWGARASDYQAEIAREAARGLVPVLIELEPDIPLPVGAFVIDHHNAHAGQDRPTSLEQVFALLRLPKGAWTRWHELVAANDRGHLPELKAHGATSAEIRAIRAADRAAQGITSEEETAAAAAVQAARSLCGGRLTVVDLPHSKTAAAADRLEPILGGPGYQNLVVAGPESVTFFGDGRLIERLRHFFAGGWWGGALPDRGYWGGRFPSCEVVGLLRSVLEAPEGAPTPGPMVLLPVEPGSSLSSSHPRRTAGSRSCSWDYSRPVSAARHSPPCQRFLSESVS